MKHIFIINPAAGTGQSEKSLLPDIRAFVKAHGEDFEIHRSLNKQEVGSYVRARASEGLPVRFYAVGGDGTICDVLNGMAEFVNAELAVIPCGSGNDFVRNFTHPENFKSLERLVEGNSEVLDVIKVNDRYCMNMTNIGTDCDINYVAGQLRDEGKAKGAMSYIQAVAKVLPKKRTYDLEYTDSDGTLKRENVMLVAVGNGMYCGGGFKSLPKASLVDGLLDVGIIRLVTGPKLLKLLFMYHQGTHLGFKEADKYVKYMQLPEFTLIPHGKANSCIDGETQIFTETNFKIIPGGVKFVIPKGSALVQK